MTTGGTGDILSGLITAFSNKGTILKLHVQERS